MIAEIKSEWRETPITCPKCGPDYALYSDGAHRPSCPTCFYAATDVEVWHALIVPTPGEEIAVRYATQWLQALLRVRGILAGGRTVGHDPARAAMNAENYISELLA